MIPKKDGKEVIRMQYDRELTISIAGSRKATRWPAQKIWWSELVEKLRVAIRGTETLEEYLKLPKSRQDELKDVGGFVGGFFVNDRRKAANVAGRDLVTLDLDNIPAGGTADALRRLDGLGCAYAVYSTRKHHEAAPRLRVLIPLDRTVNADEYEPIARKLAQIIDIDWCDPSTFEVHRLMYWPSCCADSQYVYDYRDRPIVSADGILAMYTDWRNIEEWPEVPGAKQSRAKLGAKQGDPTEKQGIVGAFCRVYDVHKAIEMFLPGVYEPADDHTPPGRYTYTGGSTTAGAIVYDDGRFLYSHHATDPVSCRLVNAFDLVRIHKFGEMDDEAAPGTPTNRLPSYSAMCEFALSDPAVAALLNQERYEKAIQDFQESTAGGAVTGATSNMSWMSKLQISATTGLPVKTTDNVLIILENDPMLKGKIAYDEFANRGVVLGRLPWDPQEGRRPWTDVDDAGLRHYLERTYGITGERRILDAVALCAHRHSFDEVKEYLSGLVWDGMRRLDTLFIDYLGAADTPYTRAVTRKSIVAAVARAMTPGCKYDSMPILAGPQGIGKSTLLRLLGRKWFSDSLQTFEGKEASEMIQGIWINEIGELTGLSKSEINAVKQFLSRTEDIYRAPFARRTQVFPRRCVFFGTTNNDEFLRDTTGNRRFWPVDVGVQPPKKNVFVQLEDEVDQIWAEAVVYWRAGEPLYLSGELEDEAKRQQEQHRETDPREGIIREFVERRVPVGWEKRSIAERRMYWAGEFSRGEVETVERDRICAAEIWVECLGGDLKNMKRADVIAINAILDRISGWKKYNNAYRYGPYGMVKGGYIRE